MAAEDRTRNRFLLEVESDIIAANRAAISKSLHHVSRSEFKAFAQRVAQLRAEYLAEAMKTEWQSGDLEPIRLKRSQYEEAVAAFDAMERAVQRGYLQFS